MDKKELQKIKDDNAGDLSLKKFDELASRSVIGRPSSDFTSRVMSALPGQGFKVGLHIWGILIGVVLVLVLWGLGGFATPEITLSIQAPEALKSINTGPIELTEMTKIFMIVNGLLVLLLIDRIVQGRRRFNR